MSRPTPPWRESEFAFADPALALDAIEARGAPGAILK